MLRSCCCLLAAAAAACHAYEPAPVDLAAHAQLFAARLPDAAALRASAPGHTGAVDLADGLDLAEGRVVAAAFHPDCRLARLEAGVARADADHAGTLPDPELSADVARILESVPHRWLAAGSLALTLPLNGRLALERDLAAARLDERLARAWRAEREARDRLDAAWARWSADRARSLELRDLCARLQDLAAIADRLAAAGSLSRGGARVFALELRQRELELDAAATAAAAGELEVRQHLGLHPDAPVTLVPALVVPAHAADAAARAARLATSPALLPLHAAHHAAEAELALAVRRQWPDLVLRGGFEEEDAEPRAAFGLSLPLPLFSGNDAAIARARAGRELAAEALRAGHERAQQDLARAELLLQHAARRQQTIAEQLLPLAEQQLADGRRLAELGQLEPLLLLDAVVRLHAARTAALDSALAVALATVAVNERTGEPTPPDPAGDPR